MALNWGSGADGVTVAVQIGFGSPPATAIASITWTDVTVYVRNLSFGYGKSDELDSYQAGRLSVTLDNRDRRFDPLHAAGPYFANLKPMVPIRVRVTYAATTVTMWTGFVSGWPQSYDPPRDATVSVTASDGFAVLQRTKLPSLYAAEVSADTPALWWRLGEQVGTVAVDSSGNGRDGQYLGGAVFNSRDGLVVDSDNAISFAPTMQALGTFGSSLAFPFSIELWFNRGAQTGGDATLAVIGSAVPNSASNYVAVIASNTSPTGEGFIVGLWNSGPVLTTTTLSSTYNYGTHHLVATFSNSTTTPIVYIDGVNAGGGAASGPGVAPTLGPLSLPYPNSTYPYTVALDEFAIYPSVLSAGRVLAHYNAGAAPLVALDTGAVVTKVLDVIGWPTADRAIETGKSTVISFDMGGKTALAVLQSLEDSEQGRFFIAPDGKATFYNRHHALTTAASTTSQATFGDGGGAELLYGDLNLEYSEDKIRNSVTTARVGGNPFTVKDAASITSYREREFSVSGLYNSSDGEIRDLAYWLLGHYAQPVTRVPAIVVQPRRSPTTLFPHIRDRKLVDRVTVKRRPQGVGTPISLDVLIEGVQHTLTDSPLNWSTTLTLSPAESTGFFILDDAVFGRLGLNALAF